MQMNIIDELIDIHHHYVGTNGTDIYWEASDVKVFSSQLYWIECNKHIESIIEGTGAV